jgi:hypothetical protein
VRGDLAAEGHRKVTSVGESVVRSGSGPGFQSSIHSSLDEACVPAQATSLMSTAPGEKEAGSSGVVGSGLGVGVALSVEVGVTDTVGDSGGSVADGVAEGSGVGDGVSVLSPAAADGSADGGGTGVSRSGVAEGSDSGVGVEVAQVSLAARRLRWIPASAIRGKARCAGSRSVAIASVVGGFRRCISVAGGSADGAGVASAGSSVAGSAVGSGGSLVIGAGVASSDEGAAEAGSASRMLAATSAAGARVRARHCLWVMVVPPGPVVWSESTAREAGCQTGHGGERSSQWRASHYTTTARNKDRVRGLTRKDADNLLPLSGAACGALLPRQAWKEQKSADALPAENRCAAREAGAAWDRIAPGHGRSR